MVRCRARLAGRPRARLFDPSIDRPHVLEAIDEPVAAPQPHPPLPDHGAPHPPDWFGAVGSTLQEDTSDGLSERQWWDATPSGAIRHSEGAPLAGLDLPATRCCDLHSPAGGTRSGYFSSTLDRSPAGVGLITAS